MLAQFSAGDPADLERRVGDGKALWVTTSCGRDWSDWCRSRLFLPTVHQLLGDEVGLTSGGRVRSRLVDAEPKTAVGGQRPEIRTAEPRDSDTLTSAAIPGVDQFERFAEIINTTPRESERLSEKPVARPLVGRRILNERQFLRKIKPSDPQGGGLRKKEPLLG